jgi:hypothetical protein
MVTVYWPAAAALLAVKVNVLLDVTGFGEKEAVTPLGKPVTDRLTLAVNPF